MPKLAASKQASLFGGAEQHALFTRRDTPDELDARFDGRPGESVRAPQASRRSTTVDGSEMRANAFAAELLAPRDEVRRRLSGVERRDEQVALVRERFGLLMQAATFRVDDVLGPTTGQIAF
jgi:hypothetical protein